MKRFELDQIDLIQQAIDANKPITNESRDVILPACSSKVAYNGDSLTGGNTHGDTVLIECRKWNQGCFDIAFCYQQTLVTIQFTVSASHSLKLDHLRHLRENLLRSGRTVDRVNHIAIIKDQKNLDQFQFDEAEGCGHSGGKFLFKVGLSRSSKLVPPTSFHTKASVAELKVGIPINEVEVRSERRSDRPRKRLRPFTY